MAELWQFLGWIQLIRLDPGSGKPAVGAKPQMIARRDMGDKTNAIEAPFIIDHGGWYWLIVSFDFAVAEPRAVIICASGARVRSRGPIWTVRVGRCARAAGRCFFRPIRRGAIAFAGRAMPA